MTASGAVLAVDDLEERRAPGDAAAERAVFAVGEGDRRLEQRILRCSPGRSLPREAGDAEELLYVVRGAGRVIVDGEPHAVDPDTASASRPRSAGRSTTPGPGTSSWSRSACRTRPPAPAPRRGSSCASPTSGRRPTTADRAFRVVAGCRGATAFVGEVPPGRAPDHFHRYDEVIYVLRGTAVVHLPGGSTAAGPGDCIHLPARVVHAVENTGAGPLELLGVCC